MTSIDSEKKWRLSFCEIPLLWVRLSLLLLYFRSRGAFKILDQFSRFSREMKVLLLDKVYVVNVLGTLSILIFFSAQGDNFLFVYIQTGEVSVQEYSEFLWYGYEIMVIFTIIFFVSVIPEFLMQWWLSGYLAHMVNMVFYFCFCLVVWLAGYILYNFVIGAYSYWGPKAGYNIYHMVWHFFNFHLLTFHLEFFPVKIYLFFDSNPHFLYNENTISSVLIVTLLLLGTLGRIMQICCSEGSQLFVEFLGRYLEASSWITWVPRSQMHLRWVLLHLGDTWGRWLLQCIIIHSSLSQALNIL